MLNTNKSINKINNAGVIYWETQIEVMSRYSLSIQEQNNCLFQSQDWSRKFWTDSVLITLHTQTHIHNTHTHTHTGCCMYATEVLFTKAPQMHTHTGCFYVRHWGSVHQGTCITTNNQQTILTYIQFVQNRFQIICTANNKINNQNT